MRSSAAHSEPPGAHGRLVAALFSAVLVSASVGFAWLSGLEGPPDDWSDAGLIGRGLAVSAGAGVAAAGCACLALGRRPRWSTLTLGLVPGIAEVLWLVLS